MSSGIDLLGPASATGAVTARPTDTRIFGSADTWFAPCSSQSSRDGTQFQAVFLNGLLAQIRYVLRASGVDLDNADDAMLWDAIRSLTPAPTLWHYGADTSASANGLVATVKPGVSAYEAFVAYAIKANNASVDGGTQANLGPGLRNLSRADGSAIRKGDWAKGDIVIVIDDGERLRLASDPAEAPPAYWHAGAAIGAGAAMAATVSPAITAYEDRLPVLLTFPNGVATGQVIALNGLVPVPLQRNDGSAIQSVDIPPGAPTPFACVGSALRLIGLGRGEVQRIALNPTLYVRTDGNDGNDGLTNSAGGAFRTLAAALAKGTSQFNFASSALTIQFGTPGTYDSPGVIPRGTGTINIIGDANSANSYIIAGAGSPGQGSVQTSGPVIFTGVTLRNTGSQSHGLAVTGSGSAILINTLVESSQTTTGAHLFTPSGDITIASGCILLGSAAAAFSSDGGRITINPSTSVTIANTPTFSNATAAATGGGKITLLGGAFVLGSANGQRYRVDSFANIQTNGAGPNAFPGSSAGTVNNGIYQ